MNVQAFVEDQPAQQQKEQTFCVRFRPLSHPDGTLIPTPDLIIKGFGLRLEGETCEVLGQTQVLAMFPKSEIVGIWPVTAGSSSSD